MTYCECEMDDYLIVAGTGKKMGIAICILYNKVFNEWKMALRKLDVDTV